MCLGWLLAMVISCLQSSSHIALDSTQRPTSSAWMRYYCSGLRGWLLEDPMSSNKIALCCTNRRTQSWLFDNFCDYITSNIWLHNSLDYDLFDYYVWSTVKKKIKKLCNTKDELKARIMAAFSNLNKDGMTRPGIEPWSPRLLANILLIRPPVGQWSGRLGFNPRSSHKMVLDAILLDPQHYKVRIQGKVEKS